MRIILIGQAPFGARTLEALLNAGEEVVAVYTPLEKPGAKPDPLKEAARAKGIRNIRAKNIQGRAGFQGICRVAARPRGACIRHIHCTAALLQRGKQGGCLLPSFDPAAPSRSERNKLGADYGRQTDGTNHFLAGRGDRHRSHIAPKGSRYRAADDTAGSLYFDRLFPMGVEAIVESVKLIREGKAPRIAQDDSKATYEPPCDDRVADIDWDSPGQQICNLIRGCDPQPGAYADFHGEMVRFYGASFVPGKIGGDIDAAPGTVTGLDLKGPENSGCGRGTARDQSSTSSAGKLDATAWAEPPM